jgi:putative ABC transport system substrate-binding protein
VKAKVTSTNDVGSAAKSLIGKVDVFYIPTDNTVVSALESVIDVAIKEKIPFFASDPESVEKGALACAAYDQYDIGYQTGELIVEFLKDPSAIKTMGVKKAQKVSTIINQKTARAISLPLEEFLKEPSITVMNKGE